MHKYICLDCEKEIEVKNKPKKNKFTQVCRACTVKKTAIKNIAVTEDLQKLCRKCNNFKPATTEHFLKNKKGFLYPYCRECKNKYLNERYVPSERIKLTDEELKIKKHDRYQLDKINDWARLLVNSSRNGAKRYGKEFHIDTNFVLELYEKQNHKCYWFGIDLVPSTINRDPSKPSLDRLDCSLGYLPGNVVLSCMAANIGRNNCESEIFYKFCKNLRNKDE
jgi:hypothetical protein